MEVKCYLKAKKKKNMKKPFIKKITCILLSFVIDPAVWQGWDHSIFIHTPLKEDFLKFHTPRNFTSTFSPSDIKILCDFRGTLFLNPLDLLSFNLLSHTGIKSFRLLNLNDFANF